MPLWFPWKSISSCGLLLAIICTSPVSGEDRTTESDSTFHVVGYLPDYRVEQFDARVCERLTDLVLFSFRPEPRGRFMSNLLDSPQAVALLNKVRGEYKIRTQLCIGGWERSQGFAEIAATTESRRQFATGLKDYCRQHHFDGADLDWEHPQNDEQSTHYGLLLAEIARQFKPDRLRLTVAMAGWQRMTPLAIDSVDAFHLMSYDAAERHSTLQGAKSDVQQLVEMGVPRAKIRLGLPFYGRGVKQPDAVKTYGEIVAAESRPLDLKRLNSDEIAGIYFNGPATIRAKTKFAQDQRLNGVMVWEIGQDAPGDDSLLKVIWESTK